MAAELASVLGGDLDSLVDLVRQRRIVVLTGAGISTESGIPDYRGPKTREKQRNPIQYRSFVGSAAWRRRYWARALIGWRRFASARANRGHLAVAELERRGHVLGVITQNVDGLHQDGGSDRVVELHGAMAHVRCLGCDRQSSRDALFERLAELNPGWLDLEAEAAPDADAEVDGDFDSFRLIECERCGGVLKPDVVFFGETCRPGVVQRAWSLFDEADVLLVVGSSLAVFSGFRFVRKAANVGKPIGIVNLGPVMRGQDLAAVYVDGASGDVLPHLAAALRKS